MTPRGNSDGARRPAVAAILFALAAAGSPIPLRALPGVFDVSLDLVGEIRGQLIEPGEVARVGETVSRRFWDLPEGAELAAWLEVWTPLVGTGGYEVWGTQPLFTPGSAIRPASTTISPRDVATLHPDTEAIQVAWSGEVAGVPRGAAIDAVAQVGDQWLLSFDIAVELDGIRADDEDIVLWNAQDGWLGVIDMGAAGVPSELDLDALEAHGFGRLWMSFDGSGEIGGFYFDDDDVLLLQDGLWMLAVDGGADLGLGGGGAVDLDAFGVPPGIFSDGFEFGHTQRWSITVP